MFISFALLNVIVTVLILFFVTLATFAIAKFNLARGTPETKKLLETKENLAPFKAIRTLGLGAGFYALFIAEFHFSREGWVCLVLAVLGIIFVGDLIRKKRFPPPKTKIKDKYVVSGSPDETKAWCWKCREHTRVKKKDGGCSNCGGSSYRMNVPIGDRKAGYGCTGCAVVPPLLLTLCALMFVTNRQNLMVVVALAVFWFLLVVGFPIVFLYRYRTWMKWARRRRQYPYGTDPEDLEEEDLPPPVVDKRDGFLSDEDL